MDVTQAAPITSAAKRPAQAWYRGRTARHSGWLLLMYFLLVGVGISYMIPFAWLVVTSLKESGQEMILPPEWIPRPAVWENYVIALTRYTFGVWIKNTLIIAVTSMIGSTLTAALAGFAFSRLRFPGRNLLFIIVLSTMMLPDAVTLVPRFVLFSRINWIDSFLPLIVPSILGGNAFSIFFFRQYFMTLPRELDEAAVMDGAGPFRIFWTILIPLSIPVIAVVSILSFIGSWNWFLEPMIYLSSQKNFTIALGLRMFKDRRTGEWNLMMAASTAMIVPVLVLFFVVQRWIKQGIALTGLSGR